MTKETGLSQILLCGAGRYGIVHRYATKFDSVLAVCHPCLARILLDGSKIPHVKRRIRCQEKKVMSETDIKRIN